MQYLTNKWNYKFTTNAGRSDAYSPFAQVPIFSILQHIDDIENKRSRLFPDRRTIPGRKVKYILAFTFAIHFYYVYKNLQKKEIISLKKQQQVALQRKVAPLFQALQDQEHTILKHRWDLLTREVLGEDFVKKSHFHNRNISWVPVSKDYYGWARAGVDRYSGPISREFNNRYVNGFETQNI